MPRFPSPGSLRVKFPGFFGTIKALRLPAARPAAFRFLHLAVPRDHASFAPAVAACGNLGPGVGHPVSPPGLSSVETTGSPKFLGSPNLRLRMFSDPGRSIRLRPLRGVRMAPAVSRTKAPTIKSISRLDSMAFGLAAYVSRCWSPFTAQGSLPGAGQALLDGLLTRKAPAKGFQLTSCSLSSLPKLLGTMKHAFVGLVHPEVPEPVRESGRLRFLKLSVSPRLVIG
jgi:hypothetical protein